MKQLRLFFLCLLATTLGTACSDDDKNDDNSVPVESITLDRETLAMKPGMTETLIPTIVPDKVSAEEVVWSSDKTSVATVGAGGVVTAVAEGTATITAIAHEKSATCLVTVVNKSLIISQAELQAAIDAADGTADNPTKITLGVGFNVNGDYELNAQAGAQVSNSIAIGNVDGTVPKHIIIDGGGNTLTSIQNGYTDFAADIIRLHENSTLRLTNITLDGKNKKGNCLIVLEGGSTLTLGNGAAVQNLKNLDDNFLCRGISVNRSNNTSSTLIVEAGAKLTGIEGIAVESFGCPVRLDGGDFSGNGTDIRLQYNHLYDTKIEVKAWPTIPDNGKLKIEVSYNPRNANTVVATGVDGYTFQNANGFSLVWVSDFNSHADITSQCSLSLDPSSNSIVINKQ